MAYPEYSLMIGFCILLVFTCGCLEENDREPIIMTFGELIDDFNSVYNWEASYQTDTFTSLDDGDILIIRDQIHNITYRREEDITQIEFNSSKDLDNFFPIEGNITETYTVGSIVEIRLQIISVRFVTIREGQPVTVDRETYKEGWDDSTNSYIPLPSKYISIVESMH